MFYAHTFVNVLDVVSLVTAATFTVMYLRWIAHGYPLPEWVMNQ